MQNLVIVESPTKARTLSKYLGNNYRVEASMGHIRDLPKGTIGIDLDHDFEPKYVIPRDKTKRVHELIKLAEKAKTLWLASDPDREGEAIAWHIKELVEASKEPKGSKARTSGSIKRVVFHEITEGAIKEAFETPREINQQLVDAQQARRVLDRLVGYTLSPLLWKKVKSGLSAGRVQSVALKLIVEKEKEVLAFKPQEYWSIEAELEAGSRGESGVFKAMLAEKNDKKIVIKNQAEADALVKSLQAAGYKIEKIEVREVKRYPAPPLTTSTLQQTASLKLGLSAKKTMMIAQALYEHGLITYMRTDSVNLSEEALRAARHYIEQNLGKAYLPAGAKVYKTKSKMAQEAHEAIRPTNVNLTADKLKIMDGMARDHVRVYDLIWKRMMASQINEAVLDQTMVKVKAAAPEVGSPKTVDSFLFRATGSVIKFDGWMKIYGIRSAEDEEQDNSQILPSLTEDEALKLLQLLPDQHFTEPPARYNEASLIKRLEELGIGRPSTYAPTLSTIQDRFYVEKKEKKFFPTELGIAVTGFLVLNFPEIFDYDFTANMEDALDEIAQGQRQWKPTIGDFYKPFSEKLESVTETAEKVKIEVELVDKLCPKCGKQLQIKFGRFGKFLACSGFPDCKHTESIEEKVDAKCPDCGGEILMRKTRRGRPFYGCKNWPTCKFASWTKPAKPTISTP